MAPETTKTKHQIYLNMCSEMSNLSKCRKHKVAAILVKNNKIISTGVNGTASGSENCCSKFHGVDLAEEPYRSEHREWSKLHEQHAEMWAIIRAGYENTVGSTLYCNLEPCDNCLKHAIISGVKEIYYTHKHSGNTIDSKVNKLVESLEIKIQHISYE